MEKMLVYRKIMRINEDMSHHLLLQVFQQAELLADPPEEQEAHPEASSIAENDTQTGNCTLTEAVEQKEPLAGGLAGFWAVARPCKLYQSCLAFCASILLESNYSSSLMAGCVID